MAGNSSATSTPIIAITTNSSTSVKAGLRWLGCGVMFLPFAFWVKRFWGSVKWREVTGDHLVIFRGIELLPSFTRAVNVEVLAARYFAGTRSGPVWYSPSLTMAGCH